MQALPGNLKIFSAQPLDSCLQILASMVLTVEPMHIQFLFVRRIKVLTNQACHIINTLHHQQHNKPQLTLCIKVEYIILWIFSCGFH
jgi:hypothetical protein